MGFRFALSMSALAATAAIVAVGVGFPLSTKEVCAAPARVSFSEEVLPLLKFRCSACHLPGGEGYEKSGFDISNYQTLMKGTKYGAMIVPGDSDSSSLMRQLDWRVGAEIRMPHNRKQLSTCDRDVIRTWIQQGAQDN